MVKQTKPILFFVIISFAMTIFLGATTASSEVFTPPAPDKTKTLPANDGGPDGCDSSRFKCMTGGEAVLDNQTGLIWLRDTRFDKETVPWQEAADFCQSFELGNKKDWRLPTRDELITLLDTSNSSPAFPDGHPFKLREAASRGDGSYWTSTEYGDDGKSAVRIVVGSGTVSYDLKVFDSGIWPVHDSN